MPVVYMQTVCRLRSSDSQRTGCSSDVGVLATDKLQDRILVQRWQHLYDVPLKQKGWEDEHHSYQTDLCVSFMTLFLSLPTS